MATEPMCREKRRALGLPYPKSNCDVCGTLIRPGWRCAERGHEAGKPTDRDRAVALRECVAKYARLLTALRNEISRGKSETAVRMIDEATADNGAAIGWRAELGIGL